MEPWPDLVGWRWGSALLPCRSLPSYCWLSCRPLPPPELNFLNRRVPHRFTSAPRARGRPFQQKARTLLAATSPFVQALASAREELARKTSALGRKRTCSFHPNAPSNCGLRYSRICERLHRHRHRSLKEAWTLRRTACPGSARPADPSRGLRCSRWWARLCTTTGAEATLALIGLHQPEAGTAAGLEGERREQLREIGQRLFSLH